MAVRADNGQPRSYLVNSILGVNATQTSFSPRYPSNSRRPAPRVIPHTASSGSGSASDWAVQPFGARLSADRSEARVRDGKRSNLRIQMYRLWKDLQ